MDLQNLPKISVLVITYNHEKYLEQALEGILNQKVEAQLEIIIADDHSCDKTLEIAKRYQANHPELFKVLPSEKNLGHTHNYERAWKCASGQFIAHCDGDDYWTDPLKLSKQLHFLQTHPEYSSCSHKMWAISEDDGSYHGPIPRTEQTDFTTEDLLEACFPHNCSLLFRNRLFTELPPFFHELTGHDWCVSVLNSFQGPIKIFPETMGVWRMRSQGLWGGRQATFHLKHGIHFLEKMGPYLPQNALTARKNNLVIHRFRLAQEYLGLGEMELAKDTLAQIHPWKGLSLIPKRQWFSVVAQIKFPELYRPLRAMRDQLLGKPLSKYSK